MENKIANLKKIVLLGPESAGKSALSEKLAAHYQTLYVPEYAREYLLTNGKNYTQNDLLRIARGQMEEEDKMTGEAAKQAAAGNRMFPVFMDTDLYMIKVWSEFVFNSCDIQILNSIVKRKYDLYLLCKPDLPWVEDELREYPDQVKRDRLYHYYRDVLVNQQVPWVEIYGNYDQRLMQAVASVNRLFQQAPDIRVAI